MPQEFLTFLEVFRYPTHPSNTRVSPPAIRSLGCLLILPAITSTSAAVSRDGGDEPFSTRGPNSNFRPVECCSRAATFVEPLEEAESATSANISAG